MAEPLHARKGTKSICGRLDSGDIAEPLHARKGTKSFCGRLDCGDMAEPLHARKDTRKRRSTVKVLRLSEM